MRKRKDNWEQDREETAAAWRQLLRSDDVEELIAQAHRDAAYFKRFKRFQEKDITE